MLSVCAQALKKETTQAGWLVARIDFVGCCFVPWKAQLELSRALWEERFEILGVAGVVSE